MIISLKDMDFLMWLLYVNRFMFLLLSMYINQSNKKNLVNVYLDIFFENGWVNIDFMYMVIVFK